jgi:hypothetical protein
VRILLNKFVSCRLDELSEICIICIEIVENFDFLQPNKFTSADIAVDKNFRNILEFSDYFTRYYLHD